MARTFVDGIVSFLIIVSLVFTAPAHGFDTARDYYRQAVEMTRAGDMEDALEFLEKAYSLDDENPAYQKALAVLSNNLGVRLAGAGDHDRAIDHFKRALEVRPSDITRKSLAQSYFANERPYDAIRIFEDLTDSEDMGTAREACWHLSRVYFHLREFEEAAMIAEELLYEDDTNPEYHLLLAQCYEQTGDKERAAEHFARVQELEVSSELKTVARTQQGRLEREAEVIEEFDRDDSRHFNLIFQSGRGEHLIDSLMEHLEDAYDDVGRELDFYPRRETSVLVFTPDQFVTITQSPSWVAGQYQAWTIRIPVPTGGSRGESLRDVVFHEYTHLLVHALSGARCPLWLNEGLAVTMQPDSSGFEKLQLVQGALGAGALPSMANLDPLFKSAGSHKEVMLAYCAARYLVMFIEEEWGLYRVPDMLEGFKQGHDADRVLQDVFGYDLERFETKWHEFLEDI